MILRVDGEENAEKLSSSKLVVRQLLGSKLAYDLQKPIHPNTKICKDEND